MLIGADTATKPYVLHAIPGRVRVHVPGWSGQGRRDIETRLRQIQGVLRVQANPLTGNMLISFNSTVIDEQTILKSVSNIKLNELNEQQDNKVSLPTALREKQGNTIRARIPVRGLNRDPGLAKRVVERLESRPGVRAHANPLTGRVLVE